VTGNLFPDESGQHLSGEALELLELVVAHEAKAEVGDTGGRINPA
jgi:hypothetical protein